MCRINWLLTWMRNYYHPQTKFGEGNVFTCVCLSTGGSGYPGHWIGRMVGYPLLTFPQTWDLDTYSPLSGHGTWIPYPLRHGTWISYSYWHLVAITGHLFKLILLSTYPQPPLTSSGCHRNTCTWLVGSMHHTEMPFCLIIFSENSLLILLRVLSRVDYRFKFKGKDQSVKGNAYFYYFGPFCVFLLYFW